MSGPVRRGRRCCFHEEDLTRFLQVMLRTFDDLNYRQEQRFHLELGLVKLVHLQRLLPVEEMLSGMQGQGTELRAQSYRVQGTEGYSDRAQSSGRRAQGPGTGGADRASAAPVAPRPSPFEADRERKVSGESAEARSRRRGRCLRRRAWGERRRKPSRLVPGNAAASRRSLSRRWDSPNRPGRDRRGAGAGAGCAAGSGSNPRRGVRGAGAGGARDSGEPDPPGKPGRSRATRFRWSWRCARRCWR